MLYGLLIPSSYGLAITFVTVSTAVGATGNWAQSRYRSIMTHIYTSEACEMYVLVLT